MKPTLTIHQAHASALPDGTPILRSCLGKRVRYQIAPLLDDELSHASTLSTSASTLNFPSSSSTATDDAELTNPPPRACVCPCCSKLITEPMAGPCGHAYCRCCLPTSCMVCGKQLDPKAARPSPMTAWLIENLEARCLSADTGCTFVGRLKEVREHMSTCRFARVSCPHEHMGCRARLPRGEMEQHRLVCAFEAFGSFMTSTLRRLDAVELQNKQLRGEVCMLRQSLHWQEQRSPVNRCADCGVLYFDLESEAASYTEPSDAPPNTNHDMENRKGISSSDPGRKQRHIGEDVVSPCRNRPKGHMCSLHHRPDLEWTQQQRARKRQHLLMM